MGVIDFNEKAQVFNHTISFVNLGHATSPNDRPHNPYPRMAAFFETIMQGGVSITLHPFMVEVLNYFILVPF